MDGYTDAILPMSACTAAIVTESDLVLGFWLCVLLTVVCPYGSFARMQGKGLGRFQFNA